MTFEDSWNLFKRNRDNHGLHYVETVDPWKDEQQVQKQLLHILTTFANFQLDDMTKDWFDADKKALWKQAFTLPYKIQMNKYKLLQQVIIEENYETLETIGDAVCNEIVAQYIYDRFQPIFQKPNYSKLIARIDAKLHSDTYYRAFAEQMKLHQLMRYDVFQTTDGKRTNVESCIADVFEAFIGVIAMNFKYGYGMMLSENILYKCLNPLDISTNLEDYTPYTQQFNDIVRDRDMPYTILHRYSEKDGSSFRLEILVVVKMKVTKELKDCFMNETFKFKQEDGYKLCVSAISKEDVFKQIMLYLQEGYSIFWKQFQSTDTLELDANE